MLAVLMMLILGAAAERRRTAEARRVIALDEVQRAARAEAERAAIDATARRLELAVDRWVETIPQAIVAADTAERFELASARRQLRAVRETREGDHGAGAGQPR